MQLHVVLETASYVINLDSLIPVDIGEKEYYLTDRLISFAGVEAKRLKGKRSGLFNSKMDVTILRKRYGLRPDCQNELFFLYPLRPSRSTILHYLLSEIPGVSNVIVDSSLLLVRMTIGQERNKDALKQARRIIEDMIGKAALGKVAPINEE